MVTLNHLADVLLTRFAWTSIQAVLLIGTVYLIGRLLPRLSAAMRCMLWWLVGAQLLLGLLWSAPVRLPLLSPASVSTTVVTGRQPATHFATTMPVMAQDAGRPSVQTISPPTTMSWRTGMATLWLAALLVQVILAMRQWRQSRRVLRESQPLHDTSLQTLCTRHAQMLGLRTAPRLRASAAIASPQVMGLWQPTVLLPAGHALTKEEAAMAMAHELAHLHRGDLWLGWVPAIAQRLFFFHPLVAWAMREYALEREAACDAQVLRRLRTAPQDYGHLLLRLGVAHPMHSGLAGASPTFQNLKRRLIMLQQNTNVMSRTRGWLLVALVALAGVLPYRVTAGSADQAQAATPATAATAVSTARPTLVPAPAPAMPPAPANLPAPPAPPPPPPPPLPPVTPPAPPAPPFPPGHDGFSARHIDIDTSTHASDGFALFDGDTITINGSDTDLAAVKGLHQANKNPLLWFRHGSAAYIIRDKAFVEQARNIYAPLTELARQQGRLAGEQGRLAGQQAGLAARDAGFAQEQAALARQQAQLAAQTASAQAASGTRAFDARQHALDAAQTRLEQRHAALQQELGASQHALESQQGALEQQQRALEQRQQQATRTAEQAMNKLLDEALAKGLAENVSQR